MVVQTATYTIKKNNEVKNAKKNTRILFESLATENTNSDHIHTTRTIKVSSNTRRSRII